MSLSLNYYLNPIYFTIYYIKSASEDRLIFLFAISWNHHYYHIILNKTYHHQPKRRLSFSALHQNELLHAKMEFQDCTISLTGKAINILPQLLLTQEEDSTYYNKHKTYLQQHITYNITT
ncbi:hypothetical protein ACJW30_11G191700 [Castanea mollissima]